MSLLKLKKLQLTNFRNLSSEITEFSTNINCIFGKNGNGKTNLLEAIYVLTNRKSFRKKTGFPQILSLDGENVEILISSTFFNEDRGEIVYSGRLSKDRSEWYLHGRNTKKKISAKSVFINPLDSYTFHSIAKFRRDWMDEHISLLDLAYRSTLLKYNTALKHRNALLAKRPQRYTEQLKALDIIMARYSKVIIDKRLQFIRLLGPTLQATFWELFSFNNRLSLRLESKWINLTEEKIVDAMLKTAEKDLAVGFTTAGIHRDDFGLLFDGFNTLEYCSLGQQKMSYLSLLFAYIELFRYKFNSYPLLLIDDVSGELDKDRWKNLVHYLEGKTFQAFITTANENFKKELEQRLDVKEFYIENGEIHSLSKCKIESPSFQQNNQSPH